MVLENVSPARTLFSGLLFYQVQTQFGIDLSGWFFRHFDGGHWRLNCIGCVGLIHSIGQHNRQSKNHQQDDENTEFLAFLLAHIWPLLPAGLAFTPLIIKRLRPAGLAFAPLIDRKTSRDSKS